MFPFNFIHKGTDNEKSVQKVLENIGLQKYSHMFEENCIDYDTFLKLRENDLRELNLIFGHRIKIRDEIDRLKILEARGIVMIYYL